MSVETLTRQTSVPTVDYRKYEVDSKRFNLEVCAPVTPETIIGWHYASGQPVRAGLFGYIATIYFNPMHDSFMVLAVSGSNNSMKTDIPRILWL